MRQSFVAQFTPLLMHWLCNWCCTIGHCHEEELDPFWWPILAAGIAIFNASHWFAEHMSQICVSSWGTYLLSFFTLPICFKCFITIEWSMLSSWATSHVVVSRPALIMALSWSLSTSDCLPLCLSSSRLSSPLQSFFNHHCTVHSLAMGQMHRWCCELSLLVYNPFWTQIRKSLQLFLCLTSFP